MKTKREPVADEEKIAPEKKQKRNSKTRTGWLFILPSLVTIFGIGIIPGLFLYGISLFNYNRGTPLSNAEFVGFQNYTRLLFGADDNFWPAVGITLLFLLTATLTTVVLGTVLAVILDSIRWGRSLFTSLVLIPLIMAPVIAGLIWRLMYNDLYGVINYVLSPLGLAQSWLGEPVLAFISVLIVETWQWTPFVVLIIFAALQSIDHRPKEAAMVDGASGLALLRYITFPMIKPIFGLVIALRFIVSMKIFETAYVLT